MTMMRRYCVSGGRGAQLIGLESYIIWLSCRRVLLTFNCGCFSVFWARPVPKREGGLCEELTTSLFKRLGVIATKPQRPLSSSHIA